MAQDSEALGLVTDQFPEVVPLAVQPVQWFTAPADGLSGEKRLWLALLELTLRDALARRRDAVFWVQSRAFEGLCELLGLAADPIRRAIREREGLKIPRHIAGTRAHVVQRAA